MAIIRLAISLIPLLRYQMSVARRWHGSLIPLVAKAISNPKNF